MEVKSQTLSPSEFRSALRRQAVTAMAMALAEKNFPETPWEKMSPGLRKGLLENQLIAFNAQNGIVRVNSIEATEEMVEAGSGCSTGQYDDDAKEIWWLMSGAGDLTDAHGSVAF